MANQVTVSNDHSINVTIEPPANVQVLVSRAVIGTVANVASANLANYVIQNSQPNITSVGTLTGLTSSGNINAPFFIGNVVGNISGNFTVPGNNTAVLFNQTGNAGASDALKFNYASNILTANGNIVANYYIGNGSQLTDVNAVTSNIANTANSVAVANVVGIGNIAVVNLDGNLSNILYGNGIFAAVPNVSNVANANFANFAGNVTNSAQPNITSVGTLTGLVVGGDITPNANITHSLGNNTNRFNDLYLAGNTIYLGAQEISANATGISFTGTIGGNATGLTNIPGANVTGQVGNALVASTVYTNAQPNITSLGNLTSLTVSGDAGIAGNLTVGGNISYVNVNNLVVQDPVIELGGGPNGSPLTTNDGKDRGTLLHYYTTTPVDAFMGWDNGNGEFAFGSNVTNNLDVMTFNTLGNVRAQTFIGNLTGLASSATVAASANAVAGANVSGQVNYAAVANSVAGANVSGAVAFATTANSVALANVSGAGNIASINLDGNVSNLLTGSGTFVAIPTVSSNANYANFAGNVTNSAQPNITSVGTLTSLDVSGNATIGNITNVDSVTYDTANVPATVAVAQTSWNDGQGTLDLGLKGGNVILQVGQQEFARVYNAEANSLIKGEVVYVSGAQGNLIKVNRAQANSETTSVGTLGIVAETITAGGEGFIQTTGAMYKLNTNGLTAGNVLYLSPSVAGGYTQTKPVAPDQLVTLGYVERVNATVGSIYIKVDNGYELDELHNVLITSPVAGQALVYNSSNLWVNGNPNIANIANTVSDNAQPNITSVGTLTTLAVTGNATFSNTIILSSTSGSLPDISGTDNAANVNQRNIVIYGGNVSSNILGNGNSAGSLTIAGGDARATTDPGSRWNATGGVFIMLGGQGQSANGSANGGGFSITGGPGFSNLYAAVGGNTSFTGGRAVGANGDATGGTLIFTSGRANSTTTGTATSGNINLIIGNVNGVSGNVRGSINIGSLAANANTTFPEMINIGQASTPTIIGGNANIIGVTNLGNVGNVKITGGTANYVLKTDGTGNLDWVAQSGGGGTPGGSNTQLQFNNNGTFGGISTVTYDGSNISLGNVGNVKITGGVNNEVMRTDGTGNLSFSSIAQTLLVGTRAGPYTVPITNYTFQVTARTGNVTVYVN